MDTKKIGKFLRDLRCEQNLTQEELGEKLGATNKTISRWETGTYMPPADILLQLSKLYGVSVNEILSGERLATADYQTKAEENIVTTINDNSVAAKRSKKILIICLAVILVLAIASAVIVICFTVDNNIYYHVTFDSNGGSYVEQQVITIKPEYNSSSFTYLAKEPDYPTKSGYSFVGWFTGNDEQSERWIFSIKSVTSDITLYARWEVATDGIEYEEEYYFNESGRKIRVYAVVRSESVSQIKDERVIIPSYYNGAPVIRIGEYAFAYNSDIYSVVIPDTVTEIANRAFCQCSSLTEVKFGKGVKKIGENAFSYCSALKNVELPANIKRIEKSTFSECKNLQNVVIPDQVEYIDAEAFKECVSLYSVTLGANITSIASTAFQDCQCLVEVHDMSKYINAVDNPYWFPNALDVYKNNATSTKLYTTDDGFVFYGVDDEPQLIRYVGDEQTITLPSDCNGKPYTLRNYVFAWSNLVDVTIGGNIKRISNNAFEHCNKLKSVTLLDGVTEIGVGAFENSSLEFIIIPNSVTLISLWAFEYCRSLGSITIPDSVRSINVYMFAYCTALKEVNLPSTLTSIGEGAFKGCTSLKNIDLPSTLTSIDSEAFEKCASLEELYIPSSVQMLDYAFSSCGRMKKIEVEEGNVNYHVDGNCLINTESKTLILASSDSVIPTDGSVTRITSYAFQNKDSLKSIYIPSSITEIPEGAFSNCYSLSEIIVDEANTNYKVVNNCLISIADNKLITMIRNSVIPDDGTVTSIGSSVFAYATVYVTPNASLITIEMPKSVTQIAKDAFVYKFGKVRLKYDGTMKECAENTEYGKDVTQLTNVLCIQCTDGELYRRWVDDYTPDETSTPN